MPILFFTSFLNFAAQSNQNRTTDKNVRARSMEATLTVMSGHWSWSWGWGCVWLLRGNYPSVSGCLAKTCPAPPAELSHNLNDLSPPWPWPATGSGTRRGIDRSRARGRGHRPRYSVSAPAFTTDHTSHCKCPFTFGYILHLFSY